MYNAYLQTGEIYLIWTPKSEAKIGVSMAILTSYTSLRLIFEYKLIIPGWRPFGG